jgi:hypothetical protein
MKKWLWSLTLALLVWAVGLKFSPEGTIWGGLAQLRFEVLSILFGAVVGLLFGLVATKGRTSAEERRKFLYAPIACGLVGFVLTFGPSPARTVAGTSVGVVLGFVIAGVNYSVSGHRIRRR